MHSAYALGGVIGVTLPLMNSYNKTEAASFPIKDMLSKDSPLFSPLFSLCFSSFESY